MSCLMAALLCILSFESGSRMGLKSDSFTEQHMGCMKSSLADLFVCNQIADMVSSRGSHACAVLDDKLYAIGGWAATKPLVSSSMQLHCV